MKPVTFDVILEPSPEGGFTVFVPALPGCISEGESEEEALENIKDAICLWLTDQEEETQAELARHRDRARRVSISR